MELSKGMAFGETYVSKIDGRTIERRWFVKAAGPKSVRVEYTDSDSRWFQWWVEEQSGTGLLMSRSHAEELFSNPSIHRIS